MQLQGKNRQMFGQNDYLTIADNLALLILSRKRLFFNLIRIESELMAIETCLELDGYNPQLHNHDQPVRLYQ